MQQQHFYSSRSTCQCSQDEGPIYVRDTVCGLNELTNLFYLLVFICSVFYFLGILVFSSVCIGKLIMICLLLHSLSKIMKPLDILLHFSEVLYAFIENIGIISYVALAIYLTIWIKTYERTFPSPEQSKFRVMTFSLKILVWVFSGAYLIGAVVFSILQAQDVGPHNFLPYVTLSYLGYLSLNIIIIGVLLLRRIRDLSGNIYKQSSLELIFHIIFTVLFVVFRIILDIIVVLDLGHSAVKNCRQESYEWSYTILIIEMSSVFPCSSFVIFLILTHQDQQEDRTPRLTRSQSNIEESSAVLSFDTRRLSTNLNSLE